MNRLVLLLLMLVVVLSPLPLGSNREWSWTLCALLVSLITLLWVVTRSWRGGEVQRVMHPAIPLLFLAACAWVVVQASAWAPQSWGHPLWGQAAAVLGIELPGLVSLSAEDSWTALLRLLSYALVFFLAFQLGRERSRAHAMMLWLATAGVVYALFGLVVFWSGESPEWLFRGEVLLPDLRSTFINRNHFATWQGLTLLCAIVLLYMRIAKSRTRPYAMPTDRAGTVEQFILEAWLPLTIVLLMVTALLLTHSRGGFVSALAGTIVLLMLLDSHSATKKLSLRVVVGAALAVCTLAFYMSSEVLLDRIDRTDITNEERVIVFENIQHGIGENPVLGFGYGTFADSFRLYDRIESPVHYDRAHNTWLENLFELGIPAALALFLAIGGLALTCLKGVRQRHRDWAFPALGVAASVLVGVHALVDFSLQLPAVAILYACVMGVACAQSFSSQQ
ncbi:MAG: O-antigen ligase family protein [Xanthomonadales bacterium]|nr:O-antigen ligase family protein [Xanthomonadales bacterium]